MKILKADVIVLGEALWDLFPARAGEDLRTRRLDVRQLGGAPANVARTLARLGLDVAMIAAVGDDALGRGVVDELQRDGVDVRAITPVAARTGITFVDVGAERSFLGYRAGSADFALTEAMLPKLLRARFLHVGSTSLSRAPASEATMAAITEARARGARLSIDVNLYRHLWPRGVDPARALAPLLDDADVVKVSEPDLRALGTDLESLHASRGDRLTILTRAERGAIARLGPLTIEHLVRARTVVDPTGAGDAFTAGALAVLAGARWPIDEAVVARALAIGSSLGARAVTKLGATTALGSCAREARQLRSALAVPPRRR